ncbi:MAG: hypothetical protein WBE79_14955 [Candidatus Cybelea sp.]
MPKCISYPCFVAQPEKIQILREWRERPDLPVPRETIVDVLEAVPRSFQRFAPELYSYIENPVGPFDVAQGLLQMLIFLDENGNVDEEGLPELLEPINVRMGPFAFSRIGDGNPGLYRVIRVSDMAPTDCAA